MMNHPQTPKGIAPMPMPLPPARLFDDRRLRSELVTPEPSWEARRASKMREHFPVKDSPPARGLTLTAPVQPSIDAGYGSPDRLPGGNAF